MPRKKVIGRCGVVVAVLLMAALSGSPDKVALAAPGDITSVAGTNTERQSGTLNNSFSLQGAAPSVTSVSPSSGSTAGATSVTIMGTNLTGATSVTFGGTAATSFAAVGSTQITAVAPAHAAGAVDVLVTTAGGASANTSADNYTYVAFGAPTIASVSPTSGTTAGGTSVTITGASPFGTATNFAVGTSPVSVAIGDLNGDGKPDLATANSTNSNNVSVLLGTGTGAFGAAANFAVGMEPASLAIGDLNGDGKPDLATANANNSDGVSVLLGAGTGSFGTATTFGSGLVPFSVAIGDLNGDGKPDLAVGHRRSGDGGAIAVLLGTGTGSFGSATNFAEGADRRSVAIGDLNGDSKPDLAMVSGSNDTVSVLLGTGTGAFGAATSFAAGTNPSSLAIGDLNGDSKPDLAVANTNLSGTVSVFLGTGAGAFGAATSFAVGTQPTSVAIGDLNGDGKLDLAVANLGSNNVSVLLGAGTGAFGAATNFAVGTGPQSVAIGDLNGDGKPDLAVANNTSNNVSVLLGAGTGFVNGATVAFGGTAATNVTVVSATTITATTPAKAAGAVNVVVTNPDSQSGTLSNGFTFVTPASTTFAQTSVPLPAVNSQATITLQTQGLDAGADGVQLNIQHTSAVTVTGPACVGIFSGATVVAPSATTGGTLIGCQFFTAGQNVSATTGNVMTFVLTRAGSANPILSLLTGGAFGTQFTDGGAAILPGTTNTLQVLQGVTVSGTVTLQGRTATFPQNVGHSIATVTMSPGNITANVAADGTFQFSSAVAEVVTFTASAPGYLSAQRADVQVGGSAVSLPSVQLRAGLVNSDTAVNINDISATVASFGTSPPSRVDAQGRFVDQNGDGAVTILDISAVVSSFGLSSPTSWP